MSLNLIFGKPAYRYRRKLHPIYDHRLSHGINLVTSGGRLLKNNTFDIFNYYGRTLNINQSDILYSGDLEMDNKYIGKSIISLRNFHDPTVIGLKNNRHQLIVMVLNDTTIKQRNIVDIDASWGIADSYESDSIILHNKYNGGYNKFSFIQLFDLIKEKTKINYDSKPNFDVNISTSEQSIIVTGGGRLVMYDTRIAEPIHTEINPTRYYSNFGVNKSKNSEYLFMVSTKYAFIKRSSQFNWIRIKHNKYIMTFMELNNIIYAISPHPTLNTKYNIKKISLINHKIKHFGCVKSDKIRPMKLCVGYSDFSLKNCRLDKEERLKFITDYLERYKSFIFIMSINYN